MMIKRIFLACTLGLMHVAYGATTGTWNVDAPGNWNNATGNWTPATPFPNGIGDTAKFLNKITAPVTITSTSTITVGNIFFDNNKAYTISLSGNTLTLNNGGTATITVDLTSGNAPHAITAPVFLANPLLFKHNASDDFTMSGVISGGALTKEGTGTLVLSNTGNTYASTTINDGTLSISSNRNLGSGGLTINNGALRTTASLTIPLARAISIPSAAAFEPKVGTTTVDSAISGGILLKLGDGTLVLTNAANSYTGGTILLNGTLSISSNGNLGASGDISISGGSLRTTASFTIPAARAISITPAPAFEPTLGVTTTINGVISGAGGILRNNGDGTLVLTNAANSYTGGTILNAGTLSISSNGNLGDAAGGITFSGGALRTTATFTIPAARAISIPSSATFEVNPTFTTTVDGVISNVGGVTKIGAGTLVLTAANTYGGGTTINAGVLSISSNGNLGGSSGGITFGGGTLRTTALFAIPATRAISILSAATFEPIGVTTSITGVISGSGGTLTKTGSGTLLLINANTYTGGTTISNGTLSLSGTGALASSGAVNLNGGASVFDITTLIAGGLLIGDLSGVAGSSVALDVKSLTFGTPTNTTFAGNISGSGTLTKQGSGTFTVSGANTFTGIFDVNAGTLSMASTGLFPPASTTNIAAGATLTGTGTLGAVNLNGTVSPGSSIGTINVGNIAFNAGSNFVIEISTTASDKIVSSGVVTINPGAILTLSGSGLTTPLSSYLIIDSSTPLVRNADFILVHPFTRFNFVVQYDPQDVLVFLQFASDFLAIGNAAGPARCFNSLLNNLAPDLIPVLDVLNVQTVAQWQDSFNQMQPSSFDTIALAEENVAERIRQNFSTHFFEQRVESCNSGQPWRLWVAPFVEHVHQRGKGENKGYKENFRGFTAAADYQFMNRWTLTSGFSWADSDVGIQGGRASGDFKTYAGSVGAIWKNSHFFADGLLSYLFSKVHAKRKMHFTGPNVAPVTRKAHHNQDTNQVMGHLGGGYDYKFYTGDHETLNLYPFVDIDYIYVLQPGYKESGAQSLNLHVTHKNYDLLRPEAGVGFGYAGCFEKVRVNADVSVSYIREQRFLGKKTKAHFENSSCTFTVKGLSPTNNLVSPTVKITLSNTKATPISLSIGYHGEFGSSFIENAGEAELKIAF